MISVSKSVLRRKVAELLVVRASGHASDSEREHPLWELTNSQLERLLGEGVGGVILFGGSTSELRYRCQRLQGWAARPLLLCADAEEGLGQRFAGGTWLVPPLSLGKIFQKDSQAALKMAEHYGSCIGEQANRCGLNWILAPVCDVNSNPRNPVINLRAWGEDPITVSELVCAFHKGLSSKGVLSCAKHFPGHGDTEVDSHIDLPILGHNMSRLEELELVPFQSIIAAGVSSIMTGHLLINNIDPINPATLSTKIISNLLRGSLSFQGLVVTDALIMSAITKKFGPGEAAVMAFAAGADLIMMPESPDKAIDAIVDSLLKESIPLSRLEESLSRRRLALEGIKEVKCADSKEFFPPESLNFESISEKQFSKELINKSLEFRNPGKIKSTVSGINLLWIDSIFSSPLINSSAPAIYLPELAGFRSLICHPSGVSPWQDDPNSPLALDNIGHGPVLLQLFIRGRPFSGTAYRKEPWISAVKQLQRRELLDGLIVYGCPYLWFELLEALDESISAAYSPGQMPEAQSHAISSLFDSDCAKATLSLLMFKEFSD